VREPWWQYIVGLYNSRHASQLAGWPHRYAAWVVDALEALVPAMDQHMREESERKGRKLNPG